MEQGRRVKENEYGIDTPMSFHGYACHTYTRKAPPTNTVVIVGSFVVLCQCGCVADVNVRKRCVVRWRRTQCSGGGGGPLRLSSFYRRRRRHTRQPTRAGLLKMRSYCMRSAAVWLSTQSLSLDCETVQCRLVPVVEGSEKNA